MPSSQVLCPVGKTLALSVTNSAKADTLPVPDEPTGYCSFLNTGSARIALTMAAQGAAGAAGNSPLPVAPTAVEAAEAAPTRTFELPASMILPVILRVPGFPLNVNAIGSAAGPSLLFITPVAIQN